MGITRRRNHAPTWEPSGGTATVVLGDDAGVKKLKVVDVNQNPVADMQSDKTVQFYGAGLVPHVSKSANYTLSKNDRIVGFDTTGGAVTATLPSAGAVRKGQIYFINDEGGNAATNPITVATEGTETINGNATDTINTNYGGQGYYSDGSDWFTAS